MKNRKITLRITESQFKTLCDRIIVESTTRSDFIRKLLDEKEHICRKQYDEIKSFKKTKNKHLSIIKGK